MSLRPDEVTFTWQFLRQAQRIFEHQGEVAARMWMLCQADPIQEAAELYEWLENVT